MLKTPAIYATFRKPVKPPTWWEGHVIYYKEYPFGIPGPGFCTLNLSSRDAEKQRRAPYVVGQFLTVSVGGKRMRGQICHIDIHRPGWPTAHSESDTFDPDEDPGDWLIKVCFPRIPKPADDN